MLAIMCIATVSFTACGGDDDDDIIDGGDNIANYLEVVIDGTKYRQQYSVPFVAITLPREVDGSLWLSSSVEDYFNGNLDFAIAIYHKSNMNALLDSSKSTYNVIGNKKNMWEQASDIHNLTLQIYYDNGNGNCEVTNGTHKVTSIKKKSNDEVVISGSFTASLTDNKKSYDVSGKYQVSVKVE